jgi:hypothetical protein
VAAKAYPTPSISRGPGRRAGILRWYPLPRTGKGQRGRTRPAHVLLTHDDDSTRSRGHVALRHNAAALALAPARRLPREAAQRPLRQALPLPCNCRLPTNQPTVATTPTRSPISPRLNLRRGCAAAVRTAISGCRLPTQLPPARQLGRPPIHEW